MKLSARKYTALLLGGAVLLMAGRAYSDDAASVGNWSNRSDWERRAVEQPRHRTPARTVSRNADHDRAVASPRTRVAMNDPAPASKEPAPVPVPLSQTPKATKPAPSPVIDGDEISFEHMPGMSGYEDHQGVEMGGDDCRGNCARGGDCWCGCGDGANCACGIFSLRGCSGWLGNVALMAGAQAFKGPMDQGRNGNFGFHEGVNFGGPVGRFLGECMREIGYQIGFEATQNNFKGDQVQQNRRTADRKQIFATAGLFHRTPCGGLQWGAVFDYLHDDYYESADMRQMRAEVSWVVPCSGEFGFWGAWGVGNSQLTDANVLDYRPINLYSLFYRRYFAGGGNGRIWGGATGNGNGLIGVDLSVPLTPSLALENTVHYMIPKQGTGDGGQVQEAWALGMHLVWYPGRKFRGCCPGGDPYLPLLSVADNSTFIVGPR